MQCRQCRTENPQGNNFCSECGCKMAYPCPDCSAEVSPGNKFCGNCGRALQVHSPILEPAIDQKIAKLQRYLPEGLAHKILSQRDRIQGEKPRLSTALKLCEEALQIAEICGDAHTRGIAFSLWNSVFLQGRFRKSISLSFRSNRAVPQIRTCNLGGH